MTMRIIILSLLLISLFTVPVSAEMFSYIDQNGKTWYVNSYEAIPEQFRVQSKDLGMEKVTNNKSKQTKMRTLNQGSRETIKKNDVSIYVASWCGYCRKLEKFLKKNNIDYKRYDIERSRKGKREYQKLGGGGIPISKVNGTIIRGFNPDAILKKLH